MPKLLLQLLNILAFIAVIVFNAWSNNGLVPGKTIGGVSDSNENFFTPAGITFAIWGIIYLGLAIFAVYQARDMFSSNKVSMPFLDEIGIWFFLSSVFNVVWLIVWLYERPGWALLLMLGLLVSLIVIYLRMNVGLSQASSSVKWLVHLPFSLYLGWITVATIANTTIFLTSTGWTGGALGEPTWAAVMVIIAAIIGSLMILTRNDLFFAMVGIWALTGIILMRNAMGGAGSQTVIIAAGVGIAALVVVGIYKVVRDPGFGYL